MPSSTARPGSATAYAFQPARCERRFRLNCRTYRALIVLGGDEAALSAIASSAPGKPLIRASLEPDALAAAPLIGREVVAFAGIARPEKFYATLRRVGAQIVMTRDFADHHAYTPREIEALDRGGRAAERASGDDREGPRPPRRPPRPRRRDSARDPAVRRTGRRAADAAPGIAGVADKTDRLRLCNRNQRILADPQLSLNAQTDRQYESRSGLQAKGRRGQAA